MGPFSSSIFGALFHPWAWRMAWRDSRSQRARLSLYALSIAAGVCSLTTIHALKRSVQEGIDVQAKNLLGTDVLVSSRREAKHPTTGKNSTSGVNPYTSSKIAFDLSEVE